MSHALKPADFKKLQISLINMAQHRECINTNQMMRGNRPQRASNSSDVDGNCWRLPAYNENGDYIEEYDSVDYEENAKMSKNAAPERKLLNVDFS